MVKQKHKLYKMDLQLSKNQMDESWPKKAPGLQLIKSF